MRLSAFRIMSEEGNWRLLTSEEPKPYPRLEHYCRIMRDTRVWRIGSLPDKNGWLHGDGEPPKKCNICNEPVPEGMLAMIAWMR